MASVRDTDPLMQEPIHEWMRWQPTGRGGRLRSFLFTPSRVVVGAGAAIALVGGFMPWAEGLAPGHSGIEPVFFSGLGGAGDGLVTVILAAAVGALTLHRTPATSRVRSVRLAPILLVVLLAITWMNGHRAALDEIAAWERRGGHGDLAPGLWLVAGGVLLMAAGSLWLLPPVLRWRAVAGDPADAVTVRARDVLVVVAGIGGTVVGTAVGILGGLALTGPRLVGTLAFGAIFGGLFGAYGGAWLMRVALDVAARRRRPSPAGSAAPSPRPTVNDPERPVLTRVDRSRPPKS